MKQYCLSRWSKSYGIRSYLQNDNSRSHKIDEQTLIFSSKEEAKGYFDTIKRNQPSKLYPLAVNPNR